MEIELQVSDILHSLKNAARVTTQKNLLPILDCVLFEVHKEEGGCIIIDVTASDGEKWVTFKNTAISCDEPNCSFCVNSKSILQALSGLAGQVVKMVLNPQAKQIACTYHNGSFSLPYEDSTGYVRPSTSIEPLLKKEVNAKCLYEAITATKYAAGDTPLRPILSTLRFDFFNDELCVVATDGHKLVKYTNKECSLTTGEKMSSFSLPRKAADVLCSAIGSSNEDVTVQFDEKCAIFSGSRFTLTTRLVEGRYPNYDAAIPVESKIAVIVRREDLIKALNMVLPFSGQQSELVKLSFENGKLCVTSEDVDFSRSAEFEIPCEYDGDAFSIGFKGSALRQIAMEQTCENMLASFTDASRAAIFSPTNNNDVKSVICLLVPMLIEQ